MRWRACPVVVLWPGAGGALYGASIGPDACAGRRCLRCLGEGRSASIHLGGEVEMTFENRPDAVAIASDEGDALVPGTQARAVAQAASQRDRQGCDRPRPCHRQGARDRETSENIR